MDATTQINFKDPKQLDVFLQDFLNEAKVGLYKLENQGLSYDNSLNNENLVHHDCEIDSFLQNDSVFTVNKWDTTQPFISSGFISSDGYFLKAVDEVGGEGQGDHMHIVFGLFKEDSDALVYFVFNGYYSSYDFSEWDTNYTIVNKKEKTIVVYE